MLIRIKKAHAIAASEITPKALYLNRRKFMMAAAATPFLSPALAGAEEEKFTPYDGHEIEGRTHPL